MNNNEKIKQAYNQGFVDALENFLKKYEKNPVAALAAAHIMVASVKKEEME